MSTWDGVLHAIMVGVGESYLGALAVELGHRSVSLGVLTTVPVFLGSLSQLFSRHLAAWFGSRRGLVTAGAAGQALSHLGLVWIAHEADPRLGPLLFFKCLFWISGMVIVPAWGAWMASLVQETERRRYFARRSAMVQLVLLLSFIGAGAYLHQAELERTTLSAYSHLLSLALVARALSASAIATQPDPVAPASTLTHSWRETLTQLRSASWKVPTYMAALTFGTHVGSPFFTPYALRELKLDYGTFAALSALTILSKAVTFPLIHRVAESVGLRLVLVLGGVGVSTLPYTWTLAQNNTQLAVIHVFAGLTWAAFEYTSYQLLLQSTNEELRIDFLSFASALTGVAQVAGGLLGGLLLRNLGASYASVFILSSILRILALALLFSIPGRELPRRVLNVFFRVLSVRPSGGAMRRPFALPPEQPEAPPSPRQEP